MAVSLAVERACRTDPDAAEMRDTTMRNWHLGCTRLVAWLAEEGRLAPLWTIETAADMLWGLMSWDLLERLITDKSWPPERYGEQLAGLFRATFVTGSQ
jgi:hypothetical protein